MGDAGAPTRRWPSMLAGALLLRSDPLFESLWGGGGAGLAGAALVGHGSGAARGRSAAFDRIGRVERRRRCPMNATLIERTARPKTAAAASFCWPDRMLALAPADRRQPLDLFDRSGRPFARPQAEILAGSECAHRRCGTKPARACGRINGSRTCWSFCRAEPPMPFGWEAFLASFSCPFVASAWWRPASYLLNDLLDLAAGPRPSRKRRAPLCPPATFHRAGQSWPGGCCWGGFVIAALIAARSFFW